MTARRERVPLTGRSTGRLVEDGRHADIRTQTGRAVLQAARERRESLAAVEPTRALPESSESPQEASRSNVVFGIGIHGGRMSFVKHAHVARGDKVAVSPVKRPPPPEPHWRDRITPRRQRGRPRGMQGLEAIDIDGDGVIDEAELHITQALAHGAVDGDCHDLEAARDAAGRERLQLAGRREMLRRFWHTNRDKMWAIEPRLRDMPLNSAVDHLMHQCDQQYAGDFATLLRNLEHDARELRLRSSVGAQMALRPPETYRAPESRLQEQHALGHDGYETARRKQRETLDRVYAHGLHKPLTGESELVDTNGYVYNRTKGTIPDWGNCANWCAARMRHDPRNPF